MGLSSWLSAAGLLVCVCMAGLAGTAGLSAQASVAAKHSATAAAKTVSIVETGHLNVDPQMERGSAIGERGQATGTYNAPVEVYLTFHAHSVTAEVTVHAKGGAISGVANANYVVTGSVGSFNGTLQVTHGTGTYRHITGTASFRGGINHLNYKCWFVAEGSGRY